MEHRIRLGKLTTVLLTKLDATTVGGLPGLILTVSDTGKKGLRIRGPDGTQGMMKATRHFLNRSAPLVSSMHYPDINIRIVDRL